MDGRAGDAPWQELRPFETAQKLDSRLERWIPAHEVQTSRRRGDRLLRTSLRGVLLSRMTDSGRQALDAAAWSRYIGEQARERLRNAGAHARFVSLKQPSERRALMAEGLTALQEWLLPL
jgi:hypothetical protein